MISANGGLPAHRYTPQVTPRWPGGSEPASVRGLQSSRSLRRVWTASQPPRGKSLEIRGPWMLKWSLLLRKAMPVVADRAKEVFMDALVQRGEYGEELT